MARRNARSFAPLALTLTLALAGAVGSTRTAHATTVTPVTVEALAARADVVIVATARAAQSHWSGGLIVTDVELEVQAVERGGEQPGARVVLRVPGGRVDHLAQRVPGAPTLEIGRAYLLLLSRARGAAAGTYDLTHLTASVLPIAQSPADGTVVVLPPSEGMTLGPAATGAATSVTAPTVMRREGVALDELFRALHAVAAHP